MTGTTLARLGLMAIGAAAFLVLSSCAHSPIHPVPIAPAQPVYSREQIRTFAPFGVHLGMDAEQACHVLLEQGFMRRHDDPAGADCAARTPLDEDDSFFGDGIRALGENKVRTSFGTVFYVSMHYRDLGQNREVSDISIWTHEKDQEAALEAATRVQWGEPTYYGSWGVRVLNYAESPEQANHENRSDFDSCGYLPACKSSEERRRCIGIRRTYAAASMRVTIFNWGRTINIADETGSQSYREIERIDRMIRSGRLSVACPVPTIH